MHWTLLISMFLGLMLMEYIMIINKIKFRTICLSLYANNIRDLILLLLVPLIHLIKMILKLYLLEKVIENFLKLSYRKILKILMNEKSWNLTNKILNKKHFKSIKRILKKNYKKIYKNKLFLKEDFIFSNFIYNNLFFKY